MTLRTEEYCILYDTREQDILIPNVLAHKGI